MVNDAEQEIYLVATDCSGNSVSSKHLHCNESSQMLGVWLANDGNKIKLINEIKKLRLPEEPK